MLKTGSQSSPVRAMAMRIARGEEAALERHHPSPNNPTSEINCSGAQQSRAVITAVGWLFTYVSEYATTDMAMTSVQGSYANHARLTQYEDGILPAEVQHAQGTTHTNAWTQEGHDDDRGTR
jgi:hypothetical protein